MTDKLWICEICGYELPKQSDLLKVCPNCNALGHFVKSKKYYLVSKNLLFTDTYLPVIIFNTVNQAEDFIYEMPIECEYRITWILEDRLNEFINKGVEYNANE